MTPKVVVLSAPSGGGKTTIARALVERSPERFGFSVSATTRAARPGERDGEAYHFLSRDEFRRRVAAGDFLEWAEYAGELYGTLKEEVGRRLREGKDVLLDIDVQGARQVRQAYPSSERVSIFILPPSVAVLRERLERRRTESDAELARRLELASREVREAPAFDHIVINDDLDRAVTEVADLIAEPDRRRRPAPGTSAILDDLIGGLAREAGRLRTTT